MTELTTAEILWRIDQFQAVQKANPPASPAWQGASKMLAPLFEEMDRRTKKCSHRNATQAKRLPAGCKVCPDCGAVFRRKI